MNRSKQKGTAAESSVIRFLQENGHSRAERRTLAGSKDKGDVSGIDGWVIEVKNCAKLDIPGWMREARAEAANAGTFLYCVWRKLAGKTDPGKWRVIVPLDCVLYWDSDLRGDLFPTVNVDLSGDQFLLLLKDQSCSA